MKESIHRTAEGVPFLIHHNLTEVYSANGAARNHGDWLCPHRTHRQPEKLFPYLWDCSSCASRFTVETLNILFDNMSVLSGSK